MSPIRGLESDEPKHVRRRLASFRKRADEQRKTIAAMSKIPGQYHSSAISHARQQLRYLEREIEELKGKLAAPRSTPSGEPASPSTPIGPPL